MIDSFDDFCLYVYVIVEDVMQQIAPLLKRRGPAPECSDSELITLVLVGECRGWDLETDMLIEQSIQKRTNKGIAITIQE
jgi:hypothetical protein